MDRQQSLNHLYSLESFGITWEKQFTFRLHNCIKISYKICVLQTRLYKG